jgi:hypothetical protein
MYIMTPDSISTPYFINPSHESVSLHASPISLLGNGSVKLTPSFTARQRLDKYLPAAVNPRKYRRIVGRVVFYAVRVVSSKVGE